MKADETLHQHQFAADQARRHFLRGIGAGAITLPMLGYEFALGATSELQPTGIDESPGEIMDPMACHKFLWSVDRQATLEGDVSMLLCDPCDCPPHDNIVSAFNLVTNFEAASDCDELFMTQINIVTIQWLIRKRFVRLNGPCNSPIGTFDGRWLAMDPAGTVLISGQLAGTLGFDPCLPPGVLRCCEYPRIMGALAGVGRKGTPAAGCIARFTFCGKEGPEPCQVHEWDVGITGILRCQCI